MLPLRQSQALIKARGYARAMDSTSVATLAMPEALWKDAIDALEQAVVLEDGEGRVLASNQAARRLIGLDGDMIHADGWPLQRAERPGAIAIRNGRPCTGMTLGVKNAGGELRWVVASARPVSEQLAAVSYTDVT